MKFHTSSARGPSDVAMALTWLLVAVPARAMLHCDRMVADGVRYNMEGLGGPHSVVVSHKLSTGSYHNISYTVDICRALKRKGKHVTDECPAGSRVCAIERLVDPAQDQDVVDDFWAVAGDFTTSNGAKLDPEVTRLSSSGSHADVGKEGIRLVMKGGVHKVDATGQKRPQRAVIEFECDKERDGMEGEYELPDDKYVPGDGPLKGRDPDGDGEDDGGKEGDGGDEDKGKDKDGEGDGDDGGEKEKDDWVQLGGGKNASLVFNSYGPMSSGSDIDVLRLTWRSKYACESSREEGGSGGDGGGGDESSHWGFFTWMVIIAFLGTAAYLIFGSWLNYNRHGARGWDLLPHGDTIRDLPYLVKDWTRSVLNTVQGSGSRGGYSAV